MIDYTVKDIQEIILGYVLEAGESLHEELEGEFYGNELNYLDFLVSKKYITSEQKASWVEHQQGDYECENIEVMTIVDNDTFPYELSNHFELLDEDWNIDWEKAEKLNLVTAPIVVKDATVDEYNDIYWSKAMMIIAEYLHENMDIYGEKIRELHETVKYYQGE